MKLNFLLIPLFTVLVAVSGSRFTSTGLQGWYQNINLPTWTPPGSVIGLVWTVIFILATLSALIVWNKWSHNDHFWWVVVIFVLNGFLNALWSYLFFGQHLIGAAIIEAALLGLSVAVLVVLIWPKSKWAALLLVPYAAWTIFATYLTYTVWWLNK